MNLKIFKNIWPISYRSSGGFITLDYSSRLTTNLNTSNPLNISGPEYNYFVEMEVYILETEASFDLFCLPVTLSTFV